MAVLLRLHQKKSDMLYNTTRNCSTKKKFSEIVCLSNAPCGGLYIPSSLPKLSKIDFLNMSYGEIAEKIVNIFTDIPKQDIHQIVEKSLKNFTTPNIFETKKLEKNLEIVELFHGPTLSFKDYPMQFLGNIIEYTLLQNGKNLNILTATSGDTGSAAINAFANKENVKIIVLHPSGKVTDFQRKQMTTCHAQNVLNIAFDGNFDDCQAIVKKITNSNFAQTKSISTVNSINWGRIMMQIVYYIKILANQEQDCNIFVPTGNFGNIFACYFLKKCGFENIKKLYISNNANDAVSKTYTNGMMKNQQTIATISPAIDISIPSNFERMLYMESKNDEKYISNIYGELSKNKIVDLSPDIMKQFHHYFGAISISDAETLQTIKNVYEKYGYILDPHTAVAFSHCQQIHNDDTKNIVISTAHPCKFNDAIQNAINVDPSIPSSNQSLSVLDEKFTNANINNINDIIFDWF